MRSVCVWLVTLGVSLACTNFLLSPSASADGSSVIAVTDDSSRRYGKIEFFPAAEYPPGSTLQIYDWGNGEYHGEIAQVNKTLNVVAYHNEKQVIIGESTFGGLAELGTQPGAILDYGNLIHVTLQRATTARDAIKIMGDLVAQYGYASGGESFSIADPHEVWVMEMIGKGEGERGAVWVALRVPEGHVTAHANQARITTFPLHDEDVAIYAPDVISFAREKGLYKGADEDFSFSDTFDPISVISARTAEVRVWSLFRQFTNMEAYEDYVQGRNLTNRMPWSIPVATKVSVNDTFWAFRQHNEHSWFDNTQDEGAEAFASPYRWRPLTWKDANGDQYLNERTVATQQTAWHFVAQARSWLPDVIGARTWYGLDDTATSVHVPTYSCMTRISPKWAHPANDNTRNGDISRFSFDSAFWVMNMVANLAYDRWVDVYPVVADEIAATEAHFFDLTEEVEQKARQLYEAGNSDEVVKLLTSFSVDIQDQIVVDWLNLWQRLFVTFRDGQITTPDPNSKACGAQVREPGYSQKWYNRIVEDTGDHYKIPESPIPPDSPRNTCKLDVPGV